MPRSTSQPDAPASAPAEDVLDRLPYGVVVVHAGAVTRANTAAARLLWSLEDGPPAQCHELFSCRAPGGPCEDGCLAERAALSDGALPEIRIDTAPGATTSALWVTAAPLGTPDDVVLHLRPGDARDRRRRSDPHWLSGPELRISALGRTWVDSREGPIGGQWLHQRPGLLLKYLVAQRNRVVHGEEIADALWPGTGRAAIGNVRHFMHGLRQKLEPDRPKGKPSSFVVTVQGGYALERRHVRIDADLFEEAVRDGTTAAGRGDDDTARERLEHGLALYRGDLVADEPFAEWVYDERDRLRQLAARGLRELVRIDLGRENLAGAAGSLDRLAELEPYDVDVYKALLAVYIAQGRRSEASRRFQAFKVRMGREFGEDPGFELADVRLSDATGPAR